jgi:hypothetical protein
MVGYTKLNSFISVLVARYFYFMSLFIDLNEIAHKEQEVRKLRSELNRAKCWSRIDGFESRESKGALLRQIINLDRQIAQLRGIYS